MDDTEIRALLTKVDDLVKAAPNRNDPTVAYRQARGLLEEAEWQVNDLPEGEDRDALVVAVGLRHDDLNRLILLESDPVRTSLDEVIVPDPAPQPGPETLSRQRAAVAERVPPNQRLVTSWPVLHVGRPPAFDELAWRFAVNGLVADPVRLTWQQFRDLPTTTVTSDFHCVTGWSRLDNTWEGVLFRDVMARVGVRDTASHVIVNGGNAYSANMDLTSLLADDVVFAWSHDGRPLTPDHGAPLRLVVPERYAWKSVKWVESIRFVDRDVPGYWEMRGYHNVGDPWLEQRYG